MREAFMVNPRLPRTLHKTPPPFPCAVSAAGSTSSLQDLMELSPHACIIQATLTMEVDLAAVKPEAHGFITAPAQFTATLTSSTGKRWQGTRRRVTLGQQ
jgi:hypothetical protein